ncbi:MAG: nitrate reductase molybdenum cofactor assembly chaperone [Alphaproteobacteria bacterium]
MHTFKILSALLSYPESDIQQAAPQFASIMAAEGFLQAAQITALEPLFDQLASRDLMDLQERYVLLFDRSKALSLHLFEHVHGESRDRGQAMVTLAEMYHEHDLAISAKELPDFIPLFLEFLGQLPPAEACALLAEPVAILSALRQRLARRQSDYAHVFAALESLAWAKPDAKDVETLLSKPDEDPNDKAALDRAWDEEQVTFGPGDQGCSGAGDGMAAFSGAGER